MLKEFKEFAIHGSVIDMAVGIIIGGAFAKISTSLVNDILMPPIGLLLGEVDFSNLFVNLSRHDYSTLKAAEAAGAPTINYGAFINTTIDFLIVAFVMFLVVRQINRFKRQAAPAKTKECPYCLSEIRLESTRCAHCTSELRAT